MTVRARSETSPNVTDAAPESATMGQHSSLWRFVAKRRPDILPLNHGDTACPLYFIHSISGELASLNELVRLLGADRQLYGVQVPREKLGGEFAQSIDAVAAHYVDLVDAFQPDGPLMLGGWSAGAIVALEMAQLFRKKGRDVVLLVVFDGLLYNTVADLSWRRPGPYFIFVRNLARRIGLTVKSEWSLRGIGSRAIREAKRFAAGMRRLRPDGSAAHGLDVYVDSSGWPAPQAAFARGLFDAAMRYAPAPYAGRIMLYSARVRPIFSLAPVRKAWLSIAPDADTIEIDGTHTNILQQPQVAAVAQDLRERLASLPPSASAASL